MQEITTKIGQKFVLEVNSNPTTGFRWYPKFDTSALELLSSRFEPDSELTGSPGSQLLEFGTLKAGDFEIGLAYKRSWEPEAAKLERWVVHVKP
ncbi:MAG: protease inhibitor I42 family protein [Nitrososphaera sp.]